jgi:hypothetical protein
MKSPRYVCFWLVTWLTLAGLPESANSLQLQLLPTAAVPTCDDELSTGPFLPCRNPIIPVQVPVLANGPADIGQWHLIRSQGSTQGREVVSIMRTADLLRSDPDFAGLMIRCRENSSLQIGLVVVRPFPPKAHPQVSIVSGATKIQLQASVLPTGVVLTLPNEAEVLAKGPWQSLSEVSFGIAGNAVTINGIVLLDNLRAAIALLESNCGDQ